jgi:2-polyprenyl-6-methoxyphenol hydroxylase-like FAD-dependent oxidoreductase
VLLEHVVAAGLDDLAARLRRATIEPETFCAVAALEFDRSVRHADGIWLGDAGATIPPFTGNGMAMAFQSAELALDPLLAYARGGCDWKATVRATAAALRGRFRVRLASAHALHPFLLRPQPQRWFAALSRARLLPFRPLYASLH